MRPVLADQTQAAFFNNKMVKEFLSALRITWLSCPQSMWTLEWAKVLIERQYEERLRQKQQVRPISFISIPGANHFVSTFAFNPEIHSWLKHS
jgi:hypothetical protein